MQEQEPKDEKDDIFKSGKRLVGKIMKSEHNRQHKNTAKEQKVGKERISYGKNTAADITRSYIAFFAVPEEKIIKHFSAVRTSCNSSFFHS